jgi:ABC-type branched-subunit amino acid transport system substrate-binding protein
MNAPLDDTDIRKYAPKHVRENPAAHLSTRPPAGERAHQSRRTEPEFSSWPEHPLTPSPALRNTSFLTLGRTLAVLVFAAVVALLAVYGQPLWQQARAILSTNGTQLSKNTEGTQSSNQAAQAAAKPDGVNLREQPARTQLDPGPVHETPVAPTRDLREQPAPTTSAKLTNPGFVNGKASSIWPEQPAPVTQAQGQQKQAASAVQEAKSTVRGVSDTEILFGISAPFTGPAKELGQNMRMGIEAAFKAANANGGVNGRSLRLVVADDGYEPTRTATTMQQLYEKDQVFALIGNVGTPTAAVALPYALDRKMLFFGAFTGAGLLRNNPPDRYVFNYRASYAEETAAVVNYLVKVKRLRPEQIAVFAQRDAYGDAGFAGVEKAIRTLRGGNEATILRLNYERNTIDVDQAVAQLKEEQGRNKRFPIKAVIMVPTYRAAAKFIEKTRDLYPDMIYTSVSFVGSTALANELMLLGKKYATGVIVTQVVPGVDGHSSLVLDYKSALAKYFPGEQPDYVSLEGYIDGTVLVAALKRAGLNIDSEKVVGVLENLNGLDIGLGTPVVFSRSEHQGIHKVWGTQLDEAGHYQPLDLE